jgi:hypothetical protein
VTRFIKKLRSHFHYIVKQKKYEGHYGVGRIRYRHTISIERKLVISHTSDTLRLVYLLLQQMF